jgi:hypothetical protein
VLARGVPLPAVIPPVLPSPADNGLYLDENKTVLREFNLALLQSLRPVEGDEATQSAKKMLDGFVEDLPVTKVLAQLMMRIERKYDAIFWQTMVELVSVADSARGGNLKALLDLLLDKENQKEPTGTLIAAAKDDLKLNATLADQWKTLAEE